MSKNAKVLKKMRSSPTNVSFAELASVCEAYFGAPHSRSGSHWVFKTPWKGDPRVNIQVGNGGKAKPYQVRQVLEAIDRFEREGL